jgi:TatA/E family protein of Tat protein translocase
LAIRGCFRFDRSWTDNIWIHPMAHCPGGCSILAVVDVGVPELLIILAVVLLVFGSKKLPELARSLGQSVKEFREGTRDHANGQEDDR